MNYDDHVRLQQLEAEVAELREKLKKDDTSRAQSEINGLSLEEYSRYGRQMIVPQFNSLEGQVSLKSSKILVVGAGGLGCPALLYLTGAGVGAIGIVDGDTVETSNLHRQVLHTTDSVGMNKSQSAKRQLSRLNPHVEITCHPYWLDSRNAFDIISHYDVVVDCTDAPAIRYLINDVSVLCGKTVVSGSGVRAEGQVTVLNFENSGPCYRCFYPKAPAPDSVSSCGDAGVLGPAIGLTGTAIAVEVIKVLTGAYHGSFSPFLAMYSAYPNQSMRHFRMRPRQKNCAVCSKDATITRQTVESGEVDYAHFCGSVSVAQIPKEHRYEPRMAQEKMSELSIIDVRPNEQFRIASLPHSVNIPWAELRKRSAVPEFEESDSLLAVCRYGNDSQSAVQKLHELGFKNVVDLHGGLRRWSSEVDPNFPLY